LEEWVEKEKREDLRKALFFFQEFHKSKS